ncbi:MAG: DUF11 domain-containing protein, partial [Cytophagales bacterium]
TATATVTQDIVKPNASATGGRLTCTVTSINISAGSTTAGVTYAWTGPGITSGANTATPTVNQPGDYTVTVTNPANGCTETIRVTVIQDIAKPTATTTGGNLTCTTTSLNLSVTANPSTSTYVWTGAGITAGANTATPTVNQPGNYNVTITNPANGCTETATAVVTQNIVKPNASATGGRLTCTVTSINISAASTTAGVTYAWTGPGITAGANTATPTVNQPGSYVVTVTNPANGCTETATATVTQDIVKPNASATGGRLTCTVTSINISAASTTAGVTYAWTGPGITAGANTASPTVNQPGDYTVTVTNTDNGCTQTTTATVTQDIVKPTVTATGGNLTCTTTSLKLSATGNPATVTYAWTGMGITADANTATPTVNQPGTYTVVVTNPANGCTQTTTATVTQNIAKPTVTATGGNLTCTTTSLKLSATGNPATVTYAWTGTGITADANTATPTVNQPGTYTVVVTNPINGCTETTIATVTQNIAKPTVTAAGGRLTCAVTSLNLSATGNPATVTYAWTGPSITAGSNTATPTINQPGVYTVIVTNPINGCTETTTATVTQSILKPTATATGGQITCAVSSIALQTSVQPANGTYEYAWTGPNSFTSTQASPSVGEAGTYTVVVTDTDNGCTVTTTATVTKDTELPGATATGGKLTCTTTSVQLKGNSTATGITYSWAGPNGYTSALQNPTVSTPGTYTLTVTRTGSTCTSKATAVVEQDIAQPTVTATGGRLTCTKTSLKLSATATPTNATYAWTGPGIAADGTTATPTVNLPGTYNLIVTDPDNGCTINGSAVVTQDIVKPANVTATGGVIVCNTKTLQITASTATTGVTYAWAGAGITAGATTATATVNAAGTFTVTITNTDNGCTATDTAMVAKPICNFDLALKKELVPSSAPLKNGDLVTFKVTVINQGALNATAIQVTDYIPAGLILQDAAWESTSGKATLKVPIATLAAGARTSVNITFKIADDFQGTSIKNTAEILSAKDGDGNPATDIDSTPDDTNGNTTGEQNPVDNDVDGTNGDEDDHDIEVIRIEQKFDLALTKKLAAGQATPVSPGDKVKFTIAVLNQGSINATAIQVSDYVPTGMTFSATDNAGWALVNGIPTTTVASLLAGASTTVDITLKIDETFQNSSLINRAEISGAKDGAGNVGNDVDSKADTDKTNDAGGKEGTASDDATGGNGTGQPNGTDAATDEDDEDPALINVKQVFDLALTKKIASTQATPIKPGNKVKFTIVVTNQGTLAATDVAVTDYVPAGMTFMAADNATWTNTGSNPTTTISGPIAPYGGTETVEIVLMVNNNFQGANLINRAEISAAKDGNGNSPADVDSKPDTNPTNDAGGKEGSAADDALNGNGTGTPGGTDAATDEDDEDPALVTIQQTFDLALKKELAAGQSRTVKQGDEVAFVITVANQGTLDATDIQLTDYVPTGFALATTETQWDVTAGKATLKVPIATLAAGATTTRTIKLKIDAAFQDSTLTNKAEISSAKDAAGGTPTDVDSTPDNTDGNQAGETNPKDNVTDENGKGGGDEDDHDFETVTFKQTFDLALKKTLANGQAAGVLPGIKVKFTLTVINQGSLVAKNVQLTDYVPAGLTFDAGDNMGWALVNGKPTTTVAGPISPNGGTATADITLTVSKTFQGTSLINKAEISAAQDGTGKTATDVDSTPDATDGNQTGEVNPKDDETDEDGKKGGDEDDHDLAEIKINQVFDLALRKKIVPSTTASPLKPGGLLTYKITVFNQGTLNASAIQITDNVPTGLTLQDAAWEEASNKATLKVPIVALAAGDSVSVNIVFKIELGFQGTSIRNVAEISEAKDGAGNPATDVDSTPDGTDGNTPGETNPKNDVINEDGKNGGDEDDQDIEIVTLQQTFDLALTKKLADGQATTVKVGDKVKFTITVVNQGTLNATAIKVSDYVPTGMTFSEADNQPWSLVSGVPTATIPNLATSATTTVDIVLTVKPDFQGLNLVNRAEISEAKDGAGNTANDIDSRPDTNPANDAGGKEGSNSDDALNGNGTGTPGDTDDAKDEDDADPALVNVGQAFDLALTKKLSAGQANPVKPGDKVKFAITVFNQGTLNATAIKVSDYVPAGMTFVPADNANWTVVGGVPTATIASLDAGKSTITEIVLTVNASSPGGMLVNRAEISEAKDGAGNTANDIDSKPDTNISNDAGGKEDSTSDDVTSGNGTGQPNDTNASTDEDDSDPASIEVKKPCVKPTLTAGNVVCEGNNTYSLTFYSSTSGVTASAGTVNGNTVTGILVGTNVTLSVGEDSTCASSLTVVSPLSCNPPTKCVNPSLTVGQPLCNATTYSVSFTAIGGTVTTSAGTISGNSITGITIGTNVIITATNGECVVKINVTSPANCQNPCENPAVSISGPICSKDGKTYAINYVASAGTTVAADAGTLANGTITGIAIDKAVTLFIRKTGCADKSVTVAPPVACFQPVFDLAIRKDLIGTGPFKPGDNVSFEVVVFNQGNVPAFNVEVTDYIPAGMSLVAGNGWATSGGNAVQTLAGPIAPNSSAVVAITLKIDANFTGTNLTNVVEITKADDDTDPNNTPPTDVDSTPGDKVPGQDDIDQEPIPLDPGTPPTTPIFDLALTKKKISSGPFTVGSLVSYEISVLNQGNVPAFAVEITDKTPTGMSLVAGNGWTANGSNATQTFAGPIPVGGSVVSIITLKINDDFTGTKLENVAEITKADNDTNPNNTPPTDRDSTPGNSGTTPNEDDTDREVIEITPKPAPGTFDLAIVKKHIGTSPYALGDTVTFSLTVLNQGTLPAFNVEVTDYIPTGLSLVDNTWAAVGTNATKTMAGPIAAGSSAVLTIRLKINTNFTGTRLTNEAEISKADDDTNPNNVPPTDKDGVIDGNQGNNGTAKDDVTNEDNKANSNNDLDNADIDRIDVKPKKNPNCEPTKPIAIAPTTVICNGDPTPVLAVTVANGRAFWYTTLTGGTPIASDTTKYRPAVAVSDTFYVEARAKDLTCNTVTERIAVILKVQTCIDTIDLKLKKMVDVKTAKLGDVITYTIKVWNESNKNATGVVVTDQLPATLQYVSAGSSASRGTYNPADGKWTIGNIAAAGVPANGDTVTLTVKAKIVGEGVTFNTAEITGADQKDKDSTPGNGADGEDDLDRACFTVPIKLCTNLGQKVVATVPSQYAGVVWKDAQGQQIGTGNSIELSKAGTYTFTSTSGTCPANGCCPVIVEAVDCCSPNICIPFTATKKRK